MSTDVCSHCSNVVVKFGSFRLQLAQQGSTTLNLVFYLLTAAVLIGIPLRAWALRGRTYASFSGVILGLSLPGIVVAHYRFIAWAPEKYEIALQLIFIFLLAAVGVHLAHLAQPRMRSRLFRWGVSVPGQACVAAGFILGMWFLGLLPIRLLLGWLEWDGALAAMQWLDLIPVVITLTSIWTSSHPGHPEVVRLRVGAQRPQTVTRIPLERFKPQSAPALDTRPLRIAQITDPHLGPWQTVSSLRGTIERLIREEPDLILLTGDFLTMESSGTPGALSEALAPLRDRPGDCFAIFGNHDHEAPGLVREAMEDNGVKLLVDDEACVTTPVGKVHLIGADYVGQGRKEHIEGLLARFPRRDDHLRLFLLHDPLGFQHVPPGAADLTLSGHTHGGQVGLVSLGLDWTVLSSSRWPDHGLFGLGPNRLYVHRGTGFYGFPLRVGVPGEISILEWVFE